MTMTIADFMLRNDVYPGHRAEDIRMHTAATLPWRRKVRTGKSNRSEALLIPVVSPVFQLAVVRLSGLLGTIECRT